MAKKTIITLCTIGVLLDFLLIFGAYFIGRNTRYKGVSTVSQNAINNANQVTADLDLSGIRISTSINLLDPVVQSNILMMQTMDNLKQSKLETEKCLDNFVDMLNTSMENVDNFIENYQGNRDTEDFVLELMIKEAEELEATQYTYEQLLKDYNKLKGER